MAWINEDGGKNIMEWLKENWEKLLAIGGVVIGYLMKKYNWLRLKPKEAVEVKTLEQDIDSQRLEDDIKRNKFTMDLLLTAEAQLQKANEKIDEAERENDNKSKLIQALRVEMEEMRVAFINRIIGLENAVRDGVAAINEERAHCNSIKKQLDEVKQLLPEDIKKQYGIS